jgi:hypothetical protein
VDKDTKIRKKILHRILKLLETKTNGARRKYVSPKDRDSYNYGYMNINEMGSGTPNSW